MKVGILTKTNTKGQLVIPKAFRQHLGITTKNFLNIVLLDNGIYIEPVRNINTGGNSNKSYLSILKKTKGAWGIEDSKNEMKRQEFELKVTKNRRKEW